MPIELKEGHIPYPDGANKCPVCGFIQKCPCPSCVDFDSDKDAPRWIWENGDYQRCAKCGFIAHVDYWQDWSWSCILLARERYPEIFPELKGNLIE